MEFLLILKGGVFGAPIQKFQKIKKRSRGTHMGSRDMKFDENRTVGSWSNRVPKSVNDRQSE